MKKMLVILFISLLMVIPTVFAINLNVEKTSSNEVLIADINKPAVFDLKITNTGSSDSFSFYNLLGFSMFPVGTTPIAQGETKDVQLQISPISEISQRGFYTFPYYIKSANDGSQIKEDLTFKIIDLEGAFETGSGDIDVESTMAQVYIRNRANFDLGNVKAHFTSPFFDFQKDFSLGPNEVKTFDIPVSKEDFAGVVAGFYTINTQITSLGKDVSVEGTVKFIEKNLVTTTKKDFGLFVNTNVIEKKNEGNILEQSQTVVKKNIISRLFTSFSPEPDVVERSGTSVYYTWNREIKPQETLTISVKTNWLFPLLIIAFIIAIVALVKQHTGTNLVLRKRVTFVKTKGGEFALKVSILVNAKRHVQRVNIIDRLPALVTLYERFGGEKPTRVDHKNRRLEWNFESLEAGDMRTLSYVIYSKVGVLGKFALPIATAIYEQEGVVHEDESNQAFFIAEQRTRDMPDE